MRNWQISLVTRWADRQTTRRPARGSWFGPSAASLIAASAALSPVRSATLIIIAAFAALAAAFDAAFARAAAMASHAILDVANAFLGVFGADLGGLVLVAAKAGVAAGIAAKVAGRAARFVRAGQCKEAAMVERCWLPGGLAVAGGAVLARLGMQRCLRRAVAGRALAAQLGLQQRMRETLP